MSIRCCKDCPDRQIGCHSTCERYLAEKAVVEERKRLMEQNKMHVLKAGDWLGDDGLSKRRPTGYRRGRGHG